MNQSWIKYLPAWLRARLRSRHNLQAIIGNSGWLLADRFVRMGIGLTIGIWIARYLGPNDYGVLGYAIAFVSLFTTFATLGLDSLVVRDLAVDTARKSEILGSALVIKIGGGVLAYALVLVAIHMVQPENKPMLALVAIIGAGFLFQSMDTMDFWFQSQLQAKYTVLARCTAFLVAAAARVWLLLSHAGLAAFAWAMLLELALASLALLTLFQTTGNSIARFQVSWQTVRRLLGDSWPLALSGMFVLLTMQLDRIILGHLRGNAAVGLYSVASQLSTLWYMVPMIFGASIAPSIARSFAAREDRYLRNLQEVYATLSAISVVAAIAISLLANPIVKLLFGPGYEGAGQVLAIHIWGGVFVFHVSIRTRALVAEGKQRLITQIAALTLFANIGLNMLLVPTYGAAGAASASLISWALCATLFPLIWRETRRSVAMFLESLWLYRPR